MSVPSAPKQRLHQRGWVGGWGLIAMRQVQRSCENEYFANARENTNQGLSVTIHLHPASTHARYAKPRIRLDPTRPDPRPQNRENHQKRSPTLHSTDNNATTRLWDDFNNFVLSSAMRASNKFSLLAPDNRSYCASCGCNPGSVAARTRTRGQFREVAHFPSKIARLTAARSTGLSRM